MPQKDLCSARISSGRLLTYGGDRSTHVRQVVLVMEAAQYGS